MHWLPYLLIGIYFTLFCYHLFVFLGRQHDKVNLYYSILNFGLIFTVYIKRIYPSSSLYNVFLEPIWINLILILVVTTCVYFFCEFMKLDAISKPVKRCFFIFAVSFIPFFILYLLTRSPVLFLATVHIAAVLLGVFAVSLVLYYSAKHWGQLKSFQKKGVIASLIVVGMLIGAGLIIALGFVPPVWLMPAFTLIYNYYFAFLLAGDFNHDHKELRELKNNLAKKVAERTRELEREKEGKVLFFINYAHEIKTPLTLISNYLDLYIRKKSPDQRLENIRTQVQKLQQDVVTFLDMEKMEISRQSAGLPAKDYYPVTTADLSGKKIVDSLPDPEKSNLLFVEDNIDLLLLIKFKVEEKYNFFYALSGKHALEKLAYIPEPDLIVSDVMMDGMDGFEFYAELSRNELWRSIPFIFLTAKNSKEDKLRALAAGALDFITKPFSITELLVKIEALLANFARHRQKQTDKFKAQVLQFFSQPLKKNKSAAWKEKLIGKFTSCRLSGREQEVAFLLCDGLINRMIAERLNITEKTAAAHVQSIFSKAEVSSRAEFLRLILD